MKAGNRLGTQSGLMAGSSLGCLFMLCYSHRFPFAAPILGALQNWSQKGLT
jgi:hypothetical protein